MKPWGMNVSAVTGFSARRLCTLALGVTLSVCTGSLSWAQLGSSGPVGTTTKAGRPSNTPEKPPEPTPDAIPGARPREPAAPASRPVGDMQPTDALFDAINRGDIAAARDALNRGADMNGVNILGMTPMELSVDLGRNDISFLLLSMRGEDSDRGSRAVGRDTPASGPVRNTAHAAKPAGVNKAAERKSTPAKNSIIATKPLATPKLFANDGGTPLPSAGFLGFDSRSVSN